MTDFTIKKYRELLGLSQPKFATQMSVNVSTLRSWERKASTPVLNKEVLAMIQGYIWLISNSYCLPSNDCDEKNTTLLTN